MANNVDMQKDILELENDQNTLQQGYDLNEIYYNRYIIYDLKKVEELKKVYISKYGFLDNYV